MAHRDCTICCANSNEAVSVTSKSSNLVTAIHFHDGEKVVAGQVLVELDREKAQYNLDLQKAALARALAKYGAQDPGKLPAIEQTPDVQKASAELAQAKQAFERAQSLFGRQIGRAHV